MDDRSGEEVRTAETVLLPDPRTLNFVIREAGDSQWRSVTLIDSCRAVSDLSLPDYVEEDVRHQYDLACNLMIYAWFVYRFHAVSQLQALRALELALRRRLSGTSGSRGMKKLLDAAVYLGLLQPGDFGSPDPHSIGRTVRDYQAQRSGRVHWTNGSMP